LSLGVAGVAAGAVTGGLALAKKGVINQDCGIGGIAAACSPDGKAAADSLKTFGLASTVAFVFGIAGTGVGIALLVTDPKPKTTAGVVLGAEGVW
jgi:hypothetical protein